MSFTATVKNEISKLECDKSEYISELCGFLINNSTYNNDHLIITTENASVARRYFSLIKSLYNIVPKITIRRQYNFNRNNSYILDYYDKANLILNNLSLFKNGVMIDLPEKYVISDEEEIKSYLRGCFISSGSVNDPKTSRYHLEFLVKIKGQADLINSLLNHFNLKSKVLNRSKGYMVYIKEAEKISDFLKIVDATNAVLYYENVRIYRDKKNQTNRLNNCEQANMDRIIASALEQIKQIEVLKENNALDLLDDKTKEALYYREKYKEASLKELSEIIEKETGRFISKSGLNHRFRKIKELASKFME